MNKEQWKRWKETSHANGIWCGDSACPCATNPPRQDEGERLIRQVREFPSLSGESAVQE